MAKLEIQGFDDFESVFSRLAEVPADVKSKALKEMGDVALARIKRSGAGMAVRDPESATHILDSLKLQKPKLNKAGGYADVVFSGTRMRNGQRTSNSEIAFLNEYGKRGQQPRSFVGAAMEQGADAITNAGGSVLLDYFEKEFEK